MSYLYLKCDNVRHKYKADIRHSLFLVFKSIFLTSFTYYAYIQLWYGKVQHRAKAIFQPMGVDLGVQSVRQGQCSQSRVLVAQQAHSLLVALVGHTRSKQHTQNSHKQPYTFPFLELYLLSRIKALSIRQGPTKRSVLWKS